MQNYNLPSVNHDNTFPGVVFVLPTAAAYDLTGATVKLQVRKNPDAPIVKEFTSPSGIVITLPYTMTIPEQSITIPWGTYKYDLKIWFADGREKTYIGGNWTINTIITK